MYKSLSFFHFDKPYFAMKAGAQMIPKLLLSLEKGNLAHVATPLTSRELPLLLFLRDSYRRPKGERGSGRDGGWERGIRVRQENRGRWRERERKGERGKKQPKKWVKRKGRGVERRWNDPVSWEWLTSFMAMFDSVQIHRPRMREHIWEIKIPLFQRPTTFWLEI